MKDWVRHLPHLSYGNYGGRKNRCRTDLCPAPIDWMDMAFARHDMNLDMGEKDADSLLARELRLGNPKLLGWYGKFYRRIAMLVFN